MWGEQAAEEHRKCQQGGDGRHVWTPKLTNDFYFFELYLPVSHRHEKQSNYSHWVWAPPNLPEIVFPFCQHLIMVYEDTSFKRDQWTPLSKNPDLRKRHCKINLITFWTGSDVYSGVTRSSNFHYMDQKPKGRLRERIRKMKMHRRNQRWKPPYLIS